jgi:ABC-type antimicrobial peptide transport system permease subunit
MTLRTLIWRSLRFHWRAHLGVVLGAAVGSAALIGALVVGDSVRGTLREGALQRLGTIQFALAAGDRLFRAQLAGDIESRMRERPAFEKGGAFAAVLRLPATATREEGTTRANAVNLFGVDPKFSLFAGDKRFARLPADAVLLNEALASQLGVNAGDTILLRVQKPSSLTREAPISPQSGSSFAMRLRVSDIIPASALGNLSLSARQVVPFNAFVSLSTLQHQAAAIHRANLILMELPPVEELRNASRLESFIRAMGDDAAEGKVNVQRILAARYASKTGRWVPAGSFWAVMATFEVGKTWRLEDLELGLWFSRETNSVELTTPRVFLDPPIVAAVFGTRSNATRPLPPTRRPVDTTTGAQRIGEAAQPVLTYLVNLLRAGTNTTPYSMVTAAGAPWTPPDLRDDEILVNQWLADDLQARPGDTIELAYFLPESGARLVEATNHFRVRAVVPMEMPWADRTLMPEFPGLARAESTHDWDAGFPLVHKIREKDEDYWKRHRGTPKAFVTLAAGQKMWGNRFGNLTAIRFPVPTNSTPAEFQPVIERNLLANLKPEELGLRFEPVREQALQAANEAQDFGQLFLGFSFFLIAAALILMALLFQFGLEQRTTEIGALLALGFTPRRVRRLFWAEGTALAFLGGVIGVIGGLAYARALLRGLATIWRDAVGAAALTFHATALSVVLGLAASVVVGAVTIWFVLRHQARRPARELLAEGSEIRDASFEPGRRGPVVWLALVALVGAATLVGWAIWAKETAAAGAFFGAGALLVVSGLGLTAAWMARLTGATAPERGDSSAPSKPRSPAVPLTLTSLAVRAVTRRRKRSLAVVGLLACGSFLIVAIGAFKLDAEQAALKRASGTGGFALIGESTLPVVKDLNTKEGREFYGLDDQLLAGASFVPFRVRDGDDASCLNLNRAQQPRLLGVSPELLAARGAFTFAKVGKGLKRADGWNLLRLAPRASRLAPDELPALGDAASIQWALGKKVGDAIEYTDERGQRFKVRLVGALANSVLQGSLIIDEAEFVRRFPSQAGYRMFLVDAPSNTVPQVSATLTRALQDAGLELVPAARRLAQFNAVQNTYLNTFQVLGGLGLLLGSAGLGVVVLRNVLERRGELAVLQAVGFRRRALQWLVLGEHGGLLWIGLGVGIVAAVVAVLPVLLAPGAEVHGWSLGATLAAVCASGLVWTWLATRAALRVRLMEALRNE